MKSYQSYPSPVEDNVDFTRQLEDIAKSKSFIAKEHPEILEDFADIVGGEYVITQNDLLYYVPKDTRLKLTMVESSSYCTLPLRPQFLSQLYCPKRGPTDDRRTRN